MATYEYDSQDEQATDRLGAALAAALPDGSVVALIGPLGAGKTRLVQAVAEASGVPRRDVVSPTFVVAQQYQGHRSIYHFDVYRLGDEDEFLELGADECFERDGISFVEWGDRFQRCLPDSRLDIRITITGDASRKFQLAGHGDRWTAVIQAVSEAL